MALSAFLLHLNSHSSHSRGCCVQGATLQSDSSPSRQDRVFTYRGKGLLALTPQVPSASLTDSLDSSLSSPPIV